MGTTLSNGVYLPDEGERNCYAGLKLNWETLDQKVADISALQSAIAGALHREIVESLPTTDIDPNTIYMILSGTSATENIYDEYIYISNTWELIGTSATDLTNYYTKSDVDGKLLLKANASDLTSHTGDTNIHVTASDKTKWNTVALIKQLRLVNTQVGSATTIAFSDIDDTNGIKVGDKCMDLDAKMFEITAVDTANQTVTVGSALIDIALDANVLHTSGNETATGLKIFENIRLTNSIRAIALDGETVDINNCYSSFSAPNSPRNGNVALYSCNTDTATSNITNLPEQKAFYLISITIRYISDTPTVKQILITRENVRYERFCSAGTWSNWVKDTDKFVTVDTVQTISGSKTFSQDIVINNSDTSQTSKRLVIRSSKVNLGDSNSDAWGITFNAGTSYASIINSEKDSASVQGLSYTVRTKDASDNLITASYRIRIFTDGTATLEPTVTDYISLGRNNYRWKDVYATNYYYGNVEFSTKFVTSDTNQTISGSKTFSSNVNVYNSDSATDIAHLVLKNKKAERGGSLSDSQNIYFTDSSVRSLATIRCHVGYSGQSLLVFRSDNVDSNNNNVYSGFSIISYKNGIKAVSPYSDGDISLGTVNSKWSTIYTNKVNNLEPSALSLPVTPSSTSYVDISSYITVLDSSAPNTYTPPSNGYITFSVTGNLVQIFHDYGLQGNWTVQAGNANRGFIPVLGGVEIKIYITASSIDKFWFIPCQGNV